MLPDLLYLFIWSGVLAKVHVFIGFVQIFVDNFGSYGYT